MRTNPRVVLDTNVLISAALSRRGAPRRVLDWAAKHGIILSSEKTFHEFATRILRPKFDAYIDRAQRKEYIKWIVLRTEFVETEERIAASRDPDDDKFLALAVHASADVIISGDEHLLELHPFRSIPILAPDAFLESGFAGEQGRDENSLT